MKNWKCTVCNYIHPGDAPPNICPICGADKSFFVETRDEGAAQTAGTVKEQDITPEQPAAASQSSSERQWKCTICGYIHTGAEPPDICPICAADKSFFIEITAAAAQPQEKAAEKAGSPQQDVAAQTVAESSGEEQTERFGWIGKLIVQFHLHPISVHTPNGVIPIALVFLVLAMVFGYEPLEKASFFNLVVVFLAMPTVLFTGFVVWQKKYRGALTSVFKIKLASAAVVAVLTSLLVFWRIIDPEIAFSGDTGSWIYLGIGAINLAAAGIAGHIGGKLALH
jgi:rubredoxin/uncharacterized membrane protein